MASSVYPAKRFDFLGEICIPLQELALIGGLLSIISAGSPSLKRAQNEIAESRG